MWRINIKMYCFNIYKNMNALIMPFEKAILIFSSFKILFFWELPEEFIGRVNHVLEPTGPFACVRNARLGESPYSSGVFLHIYPCTLFFCVLLLLFGFHARKFNHGPDEAFHTTCSAQRCYCATSLEASLSDSNFHRLSFTLHSFNI